MFCLPKPYEYRVVIKYCFPSLGLSIFLFFLTYLAFSGLTLHKMLVLRQKAMTQLHLGSLPGVTPSLLTKNTFPGCVLDVSAP